MDIRGDEEWLVIFLPGRTAGSGSRARRCDKVRRSGVGCRDLQGALYLWFCGSPRWGAEMPEVSETERDGVGVARVFGRGWVAG